MYKFMTSEDGRLCTNNYGNNYVYNRLKYLGQLNFINTDLKRINQIDLIMRSNLLPEQVLENVPEALQNSLKTWSKLGALNIKQLINDDIIKINHANVV